jgi:signal transduction histidine kinase
MMIQETLGAIENKFYKDYLGDINFSANHLLEIINGVLDMSKIESGKMKLDEETVSIKELLESVHRITKNAVDEKNMTLSSIVPDGVPPVQLDIRLIRQVLINLVTNAIKFSGEEKAVEMIVTNDPKGLIIDIVDYGIGIPQDKWDEVLLPFGQVNDPSINAGQGTGLGLPLSKAIMELHGGSLELMETNGGGMTVRCMFPLERIVK